VTQQPNFHGEKPKMLDQIQKPDLHEIAREYLLDAGGDVASATRRLIRRLDDDAELRAAIATAAVEYYAASIVEDEMRAERRAVWAEAGRTNRPKTSVTALANGIRRSLLDFPLAGGKRLRDATRDEVIEQAQLYAAQARDMGFKARWLELIGARVDDGRTVGECLTEADALALREEASA
jgi:hypothetical protein